MRSSEKSTSPTPPPPWNEADSFRETTLQFIDDPEDREAARRFSRLLYDLVLEQTREVGGEDYVTRANLRAIAADLRHLEGYLDEIGRTLENSSVEPEEEALVHFAGRLAPKVGALVAKIEKRI
jgi:hypothetical protein